MRAARVLVGLCLVAAACASDAEVIGSDGVIRYRFVGDGVTGRLVLDGTSGSLVLTNQSEAKIVAPGVYSLEALTGTRTDATVEPLSTTIPVGETVRYQVRFGEGFDLGASGFVGLTLGGADAGGFSQE